jgi:hypothetical protein
MRVTSFAFGQRKPDDDCPKMERLMSVNSIYFDLMEVRADGECPMCGADLVGNMCHNEGPDPFEITDDILQQMAEVLAEDDEEDSLQ